MITEIKGSGLPLEANMKYGVYWHRGQEWCLIGFANTYDEAVNIYRKGCADGHYPFIVSL